MATEPKLPPASTPDDRANERFIDILFDTDGRPNSEAEAVVETEGMDDDDDVPPAAAAEFERQRDA